MTTQIIFKIDEKVKKAAQIRARREGIALSDIAQLAIRSYARGQTNVELVEMEANLKAKRRAWEEADTDAAIADYLKAKKGGKLRPIKSLADLD